MPTSSPLTLGPDHALTTREVEAVAQRQRQLALSPQAQRATDEACAMLDRHIARGDLIYGITTGYGPLATTHLSASQRHTLQRNLVYHLATGMGPLMSHAQARAVMVARANALAQGASAIASNTLAGVLDVINSGLAPSIPSLGSVGASGDLTPLAHMALALMGEGAFLGHDGPSASALRARALPVLELKDREGLALVNGTSAMTGLAALNDVGLERLLDWTATLTVAYAEVFQSNVQAWDPRLGHVRPHPGQARAHEWLQARAARSQRLSHTITMKAPSQRVESQALLQEIYSVRCAPQALGASLDVLTFHRDTVERELGAVTDNPVMFPSDDAIVHGGNFFGQHVAYASDALLNAVVQAMVWSERRVARLCDPRRNGQLPAFLQPNQTGLHSGFMGAQVTASALVAWARAHATPASIQSMPTNANNQDINTMGSMGAWRAACVLERAFEVLAIDASVCAQAVTLSQRAEGAPAYSPHTLRMVEWVHRHVPFVGDDRPLSGELGALARQMSRAVVQR